MARASLSFLPLFSALGLASCSGSDTVLEGSGEDAASLAQDLGRAGGADYFRLRRDVRRCAAPLCGGFFVARVNRLSTTCSDGERRDACYVAELDLSALGLSPEQEEVVRNTPAEHVLRGDIASNPSSFGDVGRLSVAEAWRGHADVTPRGPFLRVKNEGIVCITSPCLSFSAELLNLRVPPVAIAEVDVDGISADPTDAFEQLFEPEGLLVAAQLGLVSGPAGRALGLEATEYYVPVRPEALLCGSRGLGPCPDDSFCSFPAGADCGRADAPGTCATRPEACIQIFDPVCGCDGQTYGNACTAASAGVSVERAGACEDDSILPD